MHILVVLLAGTVMPNAYGYLDPGSGSLILQIALAGFFTAVFFFKSIWGYVKRLLATIVQRLLLRRIPESEKTTNDVQNR